MYRTSSKHSVLNMFLSNVNQVIYFILVSKTNIAKHKLATQYGGEWNSNVLPSCAVDELTGCYSETKGTGNPWLRIDLGNSYEIIFLSFTLFINAVSRNYKFSIGNDAIYAGKNALCKVLYDLVKNVPTPFDCDTGVLSGRYIWVYDNEGIVTVIYIQELRAFIN